MPIVWQMPDGRVVLEQIIDDYLEKNRLPGETTDEAVLRLALVLRDKKPGFHGLTPQLVKSADVPGGWAAKAGQIVGDRKRRHAWRLRDGKIIEDPTVKDK